MRRSTVLLIATAVLAVVFVVGGSILGSLPKATESGSAVVAWFQDHGGNVRASTWFGVFGLVAIVLFACLIREQLPSPHRDVFMVGVVLFAAEATIQGWITLGLALHADQLNPATARTLLDVASYFGPALISATILMLAPIVLLSFGRAAVLPQWLGVVGGIALAEQTIESVTIFGTHGFTAPGGAMNSVLGATLVGVWLVALGIVVARRSGAS